MTSTTGEKKVFGVLCAVVTLGILFCTLWPFNPFPPNRVEWLASGGISFSHSGVVEGTAANSCRKNDLGDRPATLEILLKPKRIQFVPTVLDFYKDANPYRFQLRQYGDDLIVSREWTGTGDRAERAKIDVDHALRPGEFTLVVISSGQEGTTVYVNGEKEKRSPDFHLTVADLSGQLILGTAPVQSEPWSGEIRALAISWGTYSQEMASAHFQDWSRIGEWAAGTGGVVASYGFDGPQGSEIRGDGACPDVLRIPAHFSVPHRPFLRWPWNEFGADRQYVSDVVQNIVGFVPFGVLLCGYLSCTRAKKPATIWITVLAGCALSLSVEIAQAFIPPRMSGLTDVLTNTLGAGVGALLFHRWMAPRLREKRYLGIGRPS